MQLSPQTFGDRVRLTVSTVFLGMTSLIWIGLWIVLLIVATRAPGLAGHGVVIVGVSVVMIVVGSAMLMVALRRTSLRHPRA